MPELPDVTVYCEALERFYAGRHLECIDRRSPFVVRTFEPLQHWIDRLRSETDDGFPENVTVFRDGMSVHGRYGKPCPRCKTLVQRIRYHDAALL